MSKNHNNLIKLPSETKIWASRLHPLAIGIVSGFFAIGIILETGFEYVTAYMFSMLSVVSLLLAAFTKGSTDE